MANSPVSFSWKEGRFAAAGGVFGARRVDASLAAPRLQFLRRFIGSFGSNHFMLRTTPPPEGIVHVWNFSDFRSKRTRVFGVTRDSLYPTTSFSPTIP